MYITCPCYYPLCMLYCKCVYSQKIKIHRYFCAPSCVRMCILFNDGIIVVFVSPPKTKINRLCFKSADTYVRFARFLCKLPDLKTTNISGCAACSTTPTLPYSFRWFTVSQFTLNTIHVHVLCNEGIIESHLTICGCYILSHLSSGMPTLLIF